MNSLHVINIIAAIVTGILGLLSATSDFRNKASGNLTPIGRAAILLIVVSLVVGIWAEIKSRQDEVRATERASREHEAELVRQVDEYNHLVRGIQGTSIPLDNIAATLVLDVSYETSPSYGKRLANVLKSWKANDPRRKGFFNNEPMAPGVPQSNGFFKISPAKDEEKLAKALRPSPIVIALHRGERIVTGTLRFASKFRLVPQTDGKHMRVEYVDPRVDWSDLRGEDSSLMSFAKCLIDIRPGTQLLGRVVAFELRAPSDHFIQATDLKPNEETPPVTTGSLSAL